MGKTYIDEKWDFRASNTKPHTHGFHVYPAIMIPQIAGSLIDKYGQDAKLLFDPYCGSGSSLVEACLRGINSIGTDLNPLARVISKVKTTVINMDELECNIAEYGDIIFKKRFGLVNIDHFKPPLFSNIDYWFDKEVQKKLAFISEFISKIKNCNISNFFKVAFSETIRECSWTRNGEFKLYRMSESKMEQFDPDVFSIMESKLAKMFLGMRAFIKDKKENASVKVFSFNTVDGIPKDVFGRKKIDIIVTSPPYGDSRTTVAYGQFSRLSSEWLGFEEARKVDRRLMGGVFNDDTKVKFGFDVLEDTIRKILKKDSKRVKDVIAFYSDYQKSINSIAPTVKKGGYICYVVGNRKVKGVVLPTDEITKIFFENHGCKHIETIIRNIPNKRMPSKNSPTNISGKLDSTMTSEYIVVMKKVK